ncbi:TadE-like protein [Rosistilla carotiformis]|uniref:TadE-like protein n=1 Tax=Rosistilla carotiformis TaxID=2528017 RepID=A0A518JZD3_9BACT|nr:TadE family protein [Rosistilla carotiformis]QDV70902.1 TadE-like protein [Rosistilla carotiformis]
MTQMTPVRRARAHARRGTAIVEFAVCLPLLALLVFGTIEAASRIFLKQTLSISAYEAARQAIRVGSTTESSKASGDAILAARKVKGSKVTFAPTDITNASRGELIKVSVSAPTKDNSQVLGKFIADKTITATVVMVKE